jgi:hypothetical protein
VFKRLWLDAADAGNSRALFMSQVVELVSAGDISIVCE